MPYIKQEDRPPMDDIVKRMKGVKVDNYDLQYILFEYCKAYVIPSYNNYKNYIGELNESLAELERRHDVNTMHSDGILSNLSEEREEELDERIVDFMDQQGLEVNGDLNYVLFKFIHRRFCVSWEKAILVSIMRIRETILTPYEAQKIEENGDVE